MSYTQIVISEGVTRHPDYRMAAPINFSLAKGETLAIYGPNGGGKSLFVDILTGAHPLLGLGVRYNFGGKHNNRAADNVRLVSFRDVYGGNVPAYYQQRWNQADEQTFPLWAMCCCRPSTLGAVQKPNSSRTCSLFCQMPRRCGH